RFREHGLAPPDAPGLDTMGCVEAAERGEMRVAVCLGGNLYGSNPDADFARRAMAKIGLVAYLNTSLNTGHAHGLGETTIVLPVAARDEESQPTTQESMFNFVRLSEGGPRRFVGPRGEVQIVGDLAHRVLGDRSPISFAELADHANIRAWIAKLVPGMEAVEGIERTRAEFAIPGRVLHAPRFATPTGRARFHAHSIPRAGDERGRIRLMSVRSEGQFNTVVYEDEDIYRGQERRDVILMNARDLERLGIVPDASVRVTSDTGEMRGLVARPFDVRAGNALVYYPECNVLIGRAVDPASRTPAFKSTWVTVAPM
ncbi:MAG: histidine kinase, partial [Deltaproteobacteria bacterium]|nr:histidine kinase [Deltaproteobacteria bacterium]